MKEVLITLTAGTVEGNELVCANLTRNGSSIELLQLPETQAE